jgi:hypothetical protein
MLRPELSAVIGAERFLAEIRTTANQQHPHILPLFDSGEVRGTVFYVMPFVDGESPRANCARKTASAGVDGQGHPGRGQGEGPGQEGDHPLGSGVKRAAGCGIGRRRPVPLLVRAAVEPWLQGDARSRDDGG